MSVRDQLVMATGVIGSIGVRWLLALDVDPDTAGEQTLAGISAEQKDALEFLSRLVDDAHSLAGSQTDAVPSLVSQQLVGHPRGTALPLALALRQTCGGSLPVVPEREDRVAQDAGKMAVQLLGAYLVDPARGRESMVTPFQSSLRLDDPAVSEWCSQVLADPDLGALFSGSREGSDQHDIEAQAHWWDVTGRGGGVQLVLLPTALCEPVAVRLWSEGTFSPQGFVEGVVNAVDEMRRLLVDRRRVAVPAVVGLAGLALPAGTSVEIHDDQTMRPATPVERQLFVRVGADHIETVVCATYDYRLLPGRSDPRAWLRQHGEAAFAALDEVTVRARAAAVLATRRFDVGSTAVVGTIIHTPLSFAPAIMGYVGRPQIATSRVSEEECHKIRHRSGAMAAVRLDRIDVAIRRLLSALERPTATDGFIDAVIGWDNLFGSREGDSTLRISMSFAHLLAGDDVARRKELRSEVKDAYGRRSEVVHGSTTQLPREEAFELRHRAVELLASALDALVLRRPDLIPCDGAERSNRLMIGDSAEVVAAEDSP